jgi:hypothetical protein
LSQFNPYSPPGAPVEVFAAGNSIETTSGKPLNPWLSMWIKPRATIQQIVDHDPVRLVLVLAAISGFSEALDRASMKNMGDSLEWPMIIAIAAFVGPLVGIVGLYIGGALIRWTGNWMGGNSSSENIRAAMAWSSVPVIWSLVLWIPELAIFGPELFTSETPKMDENFSLIILFVSFAVVELILGIWAFVVFLKSLGQVQGFSAWKALGNAILASLVVIVPIALVVVGLLALTR